MGRGFLQSEKAMSYNTKMLTIEEIVQANKSGHLRANPEYHRAPVWLAMQMRLLIDSILRGYYIPPICLRENKEAGCCDIVDGYQRINAIRCFVEGDDAASQRGLTPVGALYDPSKKQRMPEFFRGEQCSWGGKKFTGFSPAEKKQFLNTELAVAVVKCAPEKARDVFIRLNRGEPLTPQDIRDTYPVKLCDLMREIAGMLGYAPHLFFCTGRRGRGTDRRRWVMQVLVLYILRRCNPGVDFVDTDSRALDGYCHSQDEIRFSRDDERRFAAILDKLTHLFPDDKRGEMLRGGILAMHLFLFADMLMDNYASDWERKIVEAHARFVKEIGEPDVSDSKHSKAAFQQRHAIYVRKMLGFMGDAVKWADPNRRYDRAGKEFVFYRDKCKCNKCGADVKWADARIHPPSNNGNQPALEACVLVHKQCQNTPR